MYINRTCYYPAAIICIYENFTLVKSLSKMSVIQKMIRKPSASVVDKDNPTGTMKSIASNALPVSVNP